MIKYLQNVKDLTSAFTSLKFEQNLRAENARANLLSNLTTMEIFDLKKSSYFKVLDTPSIEEVPIMQVEHGLS